MTESVAARAEPGHGHVCRLPQRPSGAYRGGMTDPPRPTESSRGPRFVVIALVAGVALWCGVQLVFGTENFGDSVNWVYFALLAVVAGALGWLARLTTAGSLLLALSLWSAQVPAYLLYPNPDGELGNLFPIAIFLLLVLTSPVLAVTAVAGRLARRRIRDPST